VQYSRKEAQKPDVGRKAAFPYRHLANLLLFLYDLDGGLNQGGKGVKLRRAACDKQGGACWAKILYVADFYRGQSYLIDYRSIFLKPTPYI